MSDNTKIKKTDRSTTIKQTTKRKWKTNNVRGKIIKPENFYFLIDMAWGKQ